MSLGPPAAGRSPDSTLHPRRRARSYASGLGQRASASTDDEAPAVPGGGGVPAGLSGPQALAGIGADPKAGAALAGINVQRAAAHGALGSPPAAAGTAAGGGASPGYAGLAAELSATAAGGQGGGEPPVSTFGSLPSQLAMNSPVLSRVVMAHAPYMSKLESIASSATRRAAGI